MEKHPVVRIGVDVGGTNSDAAFVIGKKIVSTAKTSTTVDLVTGVSKAIAAVLDDQMPVQYITIGSSHLINALLQNHISPVLAIRLGAPASLDIPPCSDWSDEAESLKQKILWKQIIAKGGFEYNGRDKISEIDGNELLDLAREAKAAGINTVAITGIFAPINPEQELEAARIFKTIDPNFKISLSHKIGGLSLIERENTNILNAGLMDQCTNLIGKLRQLPTELNIPYPIKIYFCSTDGAMHDIDDFNSLQQLMPIFMLHSAFTNSLNGVTIIASEYEDAIVVDIGGTSTDLGVLKKGVVVDFSAEHSLCGVNCKFPSPYHHEISLGGGTIVQVNEDVVSLSDQSVGFELDKKAIVSGGDVLTLTDVAVGCRNKLNYGNRYLLCDYPQAILDKADRLMHDQLVSAILQVWSEFEEKPRDLVLIGGGASLFSIEKLDHLLTGKFKTIVIPEKANSANAVGAAFAKVKGQHTGYYLSDQLQNDYSQREAEYFAKLDAIKNGADLYSDFHTIRVSETVIQYLPGSPYQLTVDVVGMPAFCQTSVEELNAFILANKPEQNTVVNEPSHQNTSLPSGIHRIDVGAIAGEIPQRSSQVFEKVAQVSKALTRQQLADIACGATYLGSGGGGDTKLTHLACKNRLDMGKKLLIISPNDLPPDANVAVICLCGSPTVFAERLFVTSQGHTSLEILSHCHGKKIDAVIAVEIGGANALSPFAFAANIGIPVVDADLIGRAFPSIEYCLAAILAKNTQNETILANLILVLNNGVQSLAFSAENLSCAMVQCLQDVNKLGGIAALSMFMLSGQQVKDLCALHSMTIAEQIGKIVREAKGDRLSALNRYLSTTEYKMAEVFCTGRITYVHNPIVDSQNHGYFIVENNHHRVIVGFRNQFLIARSIDSEFARDPIIVKAPDLITMIDQNTFKPIQVQDVRYNQQVKLLRIKAPEAWYTPNGIALVQPLLAYIEELIDRVVQSKLTLSDSTASESVIIPGDSVTL